MKIEKVSKRDVLKMGTTSAFVAVEISAVESATANSGSGSQPSKNFGVFNNSGQRREITLRILDGEGGEKYYSKTFDLRGLNEPGVTDPERSYFEGEISIRTNQVGEFVVQATDGEGKRASTSITVEDGGISEYELISVYEWPDGELEAMHSLMRC